MDIVFGNEDEAAAFGEFHGMSKDNTTIEQIAKKIASLPSLKQTERVVVITQVCTFTRLY